MRRLFTWQIFLAVFFLGTGAGFEPIYERPPVNYFETEPDTKLTRLFSEAEKKGWLSEGTDREILEELLDRLGVPIESQVLVYSKTSAQNSRISPRTPRAIYFSDDLYVGWVQGGEMEAASFDKKLGMVFHLIEMTSREEGNPPKLNRDRSCLNCHAGSSNNSLPGVMIRSVYPQDSGLPLFQAGSFHTRQDSPIEERWGGWYVTGEVEECGHLGNTIAHAERGDIEVTLKPMTDAPVDTLDEFFNAEPYPNGGQSDVVALMMLEHQVGTHNLLVEANLTTQNTLYRHVEMQKAFGEPIDAPLSETNNRILDRLASKVLQQMLYVDEFALPAGVEGATAFQDAFQANQIENSEGRSLKDFRLYGRLMKYRCSHLIYSEAFANLPDEIRTRILEQLHGILTEPEQWPDFPHLSRGEREDIYSIVAETVPDLTEAWSR